MIKLYKNRKKFVYVWLFAFTTLLLAAPIHFFVLSHYNNTHGYCDNSDSHNDIASNKSCQICNFQFHIAYDNHVEIQLNHTEFAISILHEKIDAVNDFSPLFYINHRGPPSYL